MTPDRVTDHNPRRWFRGVAGPLLDNPLSDCLDNNPDIDSRPVRDGVLLEGASPGDAVLAKPLAPREHAVIPAAEGQRMEGGQSLVIHLEVGADLGYVPQQANLPRASRAMRRPRAARRHGRTEHSTC